MKKRKLNWTEKLILLAVLLLCTYLYAQGDLVFCGLLLFILMLVHGVHVFKMLWRQYILEHNDYKHLRMMRYVTRGKQLALARVWFGIVVFFGLLWILTALAACILILNSIGAIIASASCESVCWIVVSCYIGLDAIFLCLE